MVRELVVLGILDGLIGVTEADGDRRALRLLTLGKLRQFTPTLAAVRVKRLASGLRAFSKARWRTFGSSSICFCRMHDGSSLSPRP
jgi:hypothetical protein